MIGQFNRSLGELRIQAIHHGLSGTLRAYNHFRRDPASSFQRDAFPALQLPVERAARNAQSLGSLQVERSPLRLFLEPPAQAKDRMIERQGLHVKVLGIQHATAVAARKLPQVQLEAELRQVRVAERRAQVWP